jgi:uncharacterized protein DUF6677
MTTPRQSRSVSPAWVALCAWIVPGGGYLALGQISRGICVLVCVVSLLILGMLIGDIRVMDPPGWNDYGYLSQMVVHSLADGQGELQRVEPTDADMQANPTSDANDHVLGSALATQPIAELSDKPWFVGQILCGPISLAASALSVHEARLRDPGLDSNNQPILSVPPSHSRSWEIGTLYTAVAGMLNLLAIIDSVFGSALAQYVAKTPNQSTAGAT